MSELFLINDDSVRCLCQPDRQEASSSQRICEMCRFIYLMAKAKGEQVRLTIYVTKRVKPRVRIFRNTYSLLTSEYCPRLPRGDIQSGAVPVLGPISMSESVTADLTQYFAACYENVYKTMMHHPFKS